MDEPLSIPRAAAESRFRTDQAVDLMLSFAGRTGLVSGLRERRYLWTDAFAVCNFLGLARATGKQSYAELGLSLVDRVHRVLGQHRGDDGRTGWLSGLSGSEAELHPTRGGLRIGKRLPERREGEPFDERVEWERDGQYFHYLTKWMHALEQVARFTEQTYFNRWARELAETSHGAFRVGAFERGAFGVGEARGLSWKMSIDLSRPLVASMGQHDPLDGLITCSELRASPVAAGDGPRLDREMESFEAMQRGGDWATADPLGIGGLLADACRVAQLLGKEAQLKEALLRDLLSSALGGLRYYARYADVGRPASTRLAFRELGLSIGLVAIGFMDARLRTQRNERGREFGALLQEFRPYLAFGSALEAFWLDPGHRRNEIWLEHRDINDVMLATSLAPEGFLLLGTLD